ncbi:N-acetylmuramic acid 6-phosphate etherase [Salinivibrio sp. ML323]|uniref:N-acetylmuramic acid 6-phosphate etherase n=1 Tax=Salinivibrio kushneri TaxID=1908198 RepID=A0AB36JZV4_9GAMM|nr:MULTISPECIES: N-acetylmuramic acid 6-phosphate etherase [Salinivibrio]OOE40639.1 N-acetylmuramic acid 6-phosphate etherase [Salinivibrio kushneri]OOE59466.1 N-acetylmuramic acid 6-phosphate etherase [Salinivibrio sp. ML323]OOE68512.1 N-acetylmuramic acid 6-phosphate etherase [Salinivibrio sp. IB282]QCP03676.1 N-acetylmuramic acid 6-phosphate etherase [Salinivibrio kushneri]
MSAPSVDQLKGLLSETRNPHTLTIDQQDTLGLVAMINAEDKGVAAAVQTQLPAIANAVDAIAASFNQGGRLIYIGAGTSGRLGVLDAVECPPTFGVNNQQVIGLIAGGEPAMFVAQEGAEDNPDAGKSDLVAQHLTAKDVVVGIAASGRTPYVLGALDYAQKIDAVTVALSCNPHAAINTHAQIAITPEVGPEALTGSTRMKSGTAQKMVLNMLSTAAMIKTGKCYQNLMVDVKASNDKLATRSTLIVMEATGCEEDTATHALSRADGEVKVAILMILADQDPATARQRLQQANGHLRDALALG